MIEYLIKNPGLHHIIEKSLKLLTHEDIASFRLLSQDCKNKVDCPDFYLMKLSHQENVPKDLIQEWKKIIEKLDNDDVKNDLNLELFKMLSQRLSKYPLKLAYDLSDEKKRLELAMFVIENSDKAIHVEAKDGKTGHLSPIHLAAMYGYVETANRMISNNLTAPNPSDVHGITPIALASQNGHLKMVQLLMTSTTNPNVADNNGWTPIHHAAGNGHLEIVRLLMTSTTNPNIAANIGETAIYEAAEAGHLEIVQLLMTSTTNPNVADNDGWTPIHGAAGNGDLEIIRLLMASTTNPNIADNNGRTAIHEAAEAGHLEIVQLLMTSTTNPNIADNHGGTPIHMAALEGHLEIVQLLMKATDNPNVPDTSGRTPEDFASLKGHHDIVKLFRKRARFQEKDMPLYNEERSGWTWVGSGRFRKQK